MYILTHIWVPQFCPRGEWVKGKGNMLHGVHLFNFLLKNENTTYFILPLYGMDHGSTVFVLNRLLEIHRIQCH